MPQNVGTGISILLFPKYKDNKNQPKSQFVCLWNSFMLQKRCFIGMNETPFGDNKCMKPLLSAF